VVASVSDDGVNCHPRIPRQAPEEVQESVPGLILFQADDEGSIPFTRSKLKPVQSPEAHPDLRNSFTAATERAGSSSCGT
jgi:hypothetical protein